MLDLREGTDIKTHIVDDIMKELIQSQCNVQKVEGEVHRGFHCAYSSRPAIVAERAMSADAGKSTDAKALAERMAASAGCRESGMVSQAAQQLSTSEQTLSASAACALPREEPLQRAQAASLHHIWRQKP